MSAGEFASSVRLWKTVYHASLHLKPFHKGIQFRKVVAHRKVDHVVLLEVVGILPEDHDVELLAGVYSHRAEPLRLLLQHRLAAEGEDRHHVQFVLEVRPGDADLEVIEARRESRGAVLPEDLGRVDLAGKELADPVAVNEPIADR